MLKFLTRSAAETRKLGRRIGKLLKAGDVVALEGELGAGKTTLVKGIAKGLGVKSEDEVSSPTFVLIHEYRGREKIFHLDWYRLDRVGEEDRRLAEECLESSAVTLVEWAERGRGILPKEHIRIRLLHRGGDRRLVKISGGKRSLRAKRSNLIYSPRPPIRLLRRSPRATSSQ